MAGLDLGKQVGPLPLGAWIAVVGTGIAVAVYSRNNTADTPVPVNDTSSDYGVGTGEVGGWVPTTGTTVPIDESVTSTTNVEWGRTAVTWLISQGYDAAKANQAVMKALSNGEAGDLSPAEWTLWRVVLMRFGAPPEPVFANEPGTSVPTPDPGVVETPDVTVPTVSYDDFTNYQPGHPDLLARDQAQYDALHPNDGYNALDALIYYTTPSSRTEEQRNMYAAQFMRTHGGIN